MRCEKCGAEWNGIVTTDNAKCPFCGEILSEDIPYKQVIDSLRMLIDRFGGEIYLESQRLDAMVNDLVPNALKEKNIIRSAISFDIPSIILDASKDVERRDSILEQASHAIVSNGIDKEWCSAILFMLGYPLEVDTRLHYPIELGKKKARMKLRGKATTKSVQQNKEINYSEKSNEELGNYSDDGDAEASIELGTRYYTGEGVEQNYIKAAQFFRRAEAFGNVTAQYNLGVMYDNAFGVEHDENKAFEYYQKSAEQGFPLGMFSLAEMYYGGQGCEKDDQKAVYWLQKAEKEMEDPNIYITMAMILRDSEDESVRNPTQAYEYAQKAVDTGNETALNLMGTFYENGTGVQQDYKKAFEYYSQAADQGVEIAYLSMGAYYQGGYGVIQNYKKAAECYQLGADAGNMYCLNALAMCYKNGQGVKQDYKRAFDLFLEAAYAGNYAAEFNVGLAYAEGQGVPQDPREAKKWFLLSADKGFGKAMASLGIYAEQGIPDGTPDLEEAFDWYLKSANAGDYGFSQWILGNCRTHGLMNSYVDKLEGFDWYLKAAYNGHPTAQNNVAVEFLNGILVDQDYDQAIDWFEKAVAQDDQFALNNYGTMLVNGNGVERDVKRGFEMVKQAAELGNHDAKVSLGVCYFEGWGKPRDLDLSLKWLSEAYAENGDVTAKAYLEKGFKYKNGRWVKRGFFSKVPDPESLPPVQPRVQAEGGCADFCEYHVADQSDEENGISYCTYFDMKVYTKHNCPYYKDMIGDLAKTLNSIMEKESR